MPILRGLWKQENSSKIYRLFSFCFLNINTVKLCLRIVRLRNTETQTTEQ